MHQDGTSNPVSPSFSATAPVLPLSQVCAQLNERVGRFLRRTATSDVEARVQEQTRISLGVFKEALTRYDLSSLSLSYNGGKDCLVLLVLFLSSLHDHLNETKAPFPSSIPSIYAYPPDPFPAVTTFVESSSKTYHLDLAHIPTNPRPSAPAPTPESPQQQQQQGLPKITIRDAFESYLTPRPHIRAIFVGTRRTDPHGATLTFFDPTDHGWPSFMRVHPVIDWRLVDIWTFLRCDEISSAVEYCPLYDMGYTSLGGRGDTVPNPKLRRTTTRTNEDGDGDGEGGEEESYRPAYELVEDEEERLGRV